MQTVPTAGIHHVTAITADAGKNLRFYRDILGLRLVKLTVNFDDPSSFHLYYGDRLGRPGSVLTFFTWPGGSPGRIGPPQVGATAFAIPVAAIDFWTRRLYDHEIPSQSLAPRFGSPVLSFADPDGMAVELIATPNPAGEAWTAGDIPGELALRGFHSVTLLERSPEKTAQLLTAALGLTPFPAEHNRLRFTMPGDRAAILDIVPTPGGHGDQGPGTVHHVAFRAAGDPHQHSLQHAVIAAGLATSQVMERVYFRSVYFREPGGVLFEIATDLPGFTADETADRLGEKLMLPPWLEEHRAAIERHLPPLVKVV